MENETQIMKKLDLIRQEIACLREQIADVSLTTDDISSIEEAERDLRSGKTKRLC